MEGLSHNGWGLVYLQKCRGTFLHHFQVLARFLLWHPVELSGGGRTIGSIVKYRVVNSSSLGAKLLRLLGEGPFLYPKNYLAKADKTGDPPDTSIVAVIEHLEQSVMVRPRINTANRSVPALIAGRRETLSKRSNSGVAGKDVRAHFFQIHFNRVE